MACCSTCEYYRKNPSARRRRNKQQREYNRQPKERQRRSELVTANRNMGKKGDGMDVSHQSDGSLVLERQSSNRSRNGMKSGRSKKIRTNTLA